MKPGFGPVVWPLAVAETIVWAALYYSFPALLPEWEAELGWSKTELSTAFTLALVGSARLAPVPYMGATAAAPTVAALLWGRGGYHLVLLLAILMTLVGLVALPAAWRSAAPQPPD